jgi:sec-independent protein translocase protein TatA
MPFGIGPLELIIVLVIILVIFGPKRLPGVGRSLGQGMREFKDSITGKDKGDDDEESAELPRAETAEPERKEPQPARAGRDDAANAFGRDE